MPATEEIGHVKQTADHEAERVLLVVVDDSDEMPIALHFACRRAEQQIGVLHSFMCLRKLTFSTGWLWVT